MEHHKKFIKNVGVMGLVLSLSRAKGIFLLMMLSKVLGAEIYGIWTQILVTISFVAPIAVLGLPYALVRFIPDAKSQQEKTEHVWSVLFVILGASILIILPFLVFPKFFVSFLYIPISLISILALLIVLEALNSFVIDIFRAFGEIGKYSFFSLGLAIGDVLFTAVALILGKGLLGALLALFLIRSFVLISSIVVLFKKIGFEIPKFIHIKEYLKFGFPIVASNLSHWIVQVSDRYFIAAFLGVLFVGYYAPAYTVGLIISLFVLPIMLILQPAVSKFFVENNIDEVKKYLSYSIKYVFFITIPAAFGLVVLSKQILTVLSTLEIAVNSYFIVPFIALSIVLYGVYGIFSQIFLLYKKTTIDSAIWIISAIFTIVLNFIFIPVIGIIGAALATLAVYALALILTIVFTSRYLTFPIDWGFFVKTIIASILMSAIILFFDVSGVFKTILAIIGGVFLYLAIMLLMGGFSKKEREFLSIVLKRKKEQFTQSEDKENKKIKICYISSVDTTMRFILFNHLKFLKSEGYDVHAVCFVKKWQKELNEIGVNVKNIKFKRSVSFISDFITLVKLYFYLKKEKFDIVHTHTPKAGLLGQLAAKFALVPIILNTVHGFYFQKKDSWLKRKFFIFLEKIAAKCSNTVFFVNREDMKTAVEEKICRQEKIKYFGGGVNLQRFDTTRFSETFISNFKKELGLNDKKIIIGIVARMVKEKGYLDLFMAFKKVINNFPEALLLVVGDPDYEKKDSIEPCVVKKYGIENSVVFLGERTDVDRIYALMDIFILPSHREGLGISAIEALAMEKPVIVTDIRGLREVVDDGKTGKLIPTGSADQIAKAIIYMINNRKEAIEMGKKGRRKVEKEFDERIIFDRIKDEYNRLLREKYEV